MIDEFSKKAMEDLDRFELMTNGLMRINPFHTNVNEIYSYWQNIFPQDIFDTDLPYSFPMAYFTSFPTNQLTRHLHIFYFF